MNDITKLREKRSFHFTKGWIDDAEPKEIGFIIDKDGNLQVAGIYWQKPSVEGAYDDENFFSMSIYVCRM